jgi:hypothetical protein
MYIVCKFYTDSFSQENDKKRKKMLNIISFETSDWSIQHIYSILSLNVKNIKHVKRCDSFIYSYNHMHSTSALNFYHYCFAYYITNMIQILVRHIM